jgi:hypothetical protein
MRPSDPSDPTRAQINLHNPQGDAGICAGMHYGGEPEFLNPSLTCGERETPSTVASESYGRA